jgi:hypothetical protein
MSRVRRIAIWTIGATCAALALCCIALRFSTSFSSLPLFRDRSLWLPQTFHSAQYGPMLAIRDETAAAVFAVPPLLLAARAAWRWRRQRRRAREGRCACPRRRSPADRVRWPSGPSRCAPLSGRTGKSSSTLLSVGTGAPCTPRHAPRRPVCVPFFARPLHDR